MIQIFGILGSRPQFIKSAAIHRVFQQTMPGYIDYAFIHTGMHDDETLPASFFQELDIPEPMYNLGVRAGTQESYLGRLVQAIEKLLRRHDPHLVMLFGDNLTTMAGALAASQARIPVAHLESGLRSHQLQYPEEVQRKITDQLSTLLFTSTAGSVENLAAEGIRSGEQKPSLQQPLIVNCGDVMNDNIIHYGAQADTRILSPQTHELASGDFIFFSLHDRKYTSDKKTLKKTLQLIVEVSSVFNINIIFTVPPSINYTIRSLKKNPLENSDVWPVSYISYLESIVLIREAKMVITDSDGLLREAYCLGKNTVLLKDHTVWNEIISLGNAVLVGNDKEKLLQETENYLYNPVPETFAPIFGDGNAAYRIAESIVTSVIR